MYKCIIVEDEEDARVLLEHLIRDYLTNVEVVGMASSVNDAIDLIQRTQPDVILLDIEISGGTGFDILNHLNGTAAHIIFTTGYEHYAVRAFRYSALDYLTKPISIGELQQAFDRIKHTKVDNRAQLDTLRSNLGSEEVKLIIPSHDFLSVVQVHDILYLKASKSYTLIYPKEGQCLISTRPLAYYEDLLSEVGFVRVHRSHVLNLSAIKRVFTSMPLRIELSNGETVPLAHRRKKALMQNLKEHKHTFNG